MKKETIALSITVIGVFIGILSLYSNRDNNSVVVNQSGSGTVVTNNSGNLLIESSKRKLKDSVPTYRSRIVNQNDMNNLYEYLESHSSSIVKLELEFCEEGNDWIAFNTKDGYIKEFYDTDCVKENMPKYYNNHDSDDYASVAFCSGVQYSMQTYLDKKVKCDNSKYWGASVVHDYYYIPEEFGFGQGTIEVMLKVMDPAQIKLRYQ